MTRRELVLNKLQELPDDEVESAIKELTLHVKARLRFGSLMDRTKSGAHSEKNLGMHGIDFYVGESLKRLFDPNGWDWKFEKFTLAEQLKRISNKLISDKVENYKEAKEKIPQILEKDISEMYELSDTKSDFVDERQEVLDKLIEFAYKESKDDDNLHYFTIRYFEDISYEVIAEEMGLSLEEVYALRKKLVRRLMKYKEDLSL